VDAVSTIGTGGDIGRGEGQRIIGARVVNGHGSAGSRRQGGSKGRVGGTFIRGRHIIN
ncbi:uncharacterized protein METZ01_LOCUS265470, partial [marine metagenome]